MKVIDLLLLIDYFCKSVRLFRLSSIFVMYLSVRRLGNGFDRLGGCLSLIVSNIKGKNWFCFLP